MDSILTARLAAIERSIQIFKEEHSDIRAAIEEMKKVLDEAVYGSEGEPETEEEEPEAAGAESDEVEGTLKRQDSFVGKPSNREWVRAARQSEFVANSVREATEAGVIGCDAEKLQWAADDYTEVERKMWPAYDTWLEAQSKKEVSFVSWMGTKFKNYKSPGFELAKSHIKDLIKTEIGDLRQRALPSMVYSQPGSVHP